MPAAVSISEAKRRLGESADRALEGEQIVIVRKSRLLVLKQFEIPEPVPMRPRGCFDDRYDKAAAKESNKLAARSPGELSNEAVGYFIFSRSRMRSPIRLQMA